jgi:hypothetical protein
LCQTRFDVAVPNPKMKFDPKKFKWFEFCPGKFHTGWIITWDELTEERDKKEYFGDEMFISRFAFNRENLDFGPILSNLYFDFDCKENLNRARHEAVDCVEFFTIRYGIPAKAIKIRFTGGKGFSIEIPFQYFNLEPNEYLFLIWKEMAEQCRRMRKWKTMDSAVYNRTRLWRLTNSRHASGYYKIPLSYDELREMKIEKIKNMALNPRGYAGPQGYTSDMERDYAPIYDLAKKRLR